MADAAESVAVKDAASILIVDDRPDLHVLLGKRRPGSAFVGGLIVFPGGAVDDDDGSDAARDVVPTALVPELTPQAGAALLYAGIRETFEEVGLWVGGELPVDPVEFPHVGRWVTPVGPPRRYDTHFFLARYRGGDVVPDHIELTEAWWERPADVLRRVHAGELDAILPTIEFLRSLSEYRNVNEAFAATGCGRGRRHLSGWTGF